MPSCSKLKRGFLNGEDNCNQVAAGVYHNRIWLANLNEITAWVVDPSIENQYTDITFVPGEGLFSYRLAKDSVKWREEYDPATKSWYQEFSGKIDDLGIEGRNTIEQLAGPDIVCVLELKAGVFKIIGKDSGARLFQHIGSSDAADVGNQIAIRAENMAEPCPHFFDTSEATTLLTLAGYEVTT